MTEQQKKDLEGFDSVLRVLVEEDKDMFYTVSQRMFMSSPDDIVRYDYDVNGKKWSVFETHLWKTCTNEDRD